MPLDNVRRGLVAVRRLPFRERMAVNRAATLGARQQRWTTAPYRWVRRFFLVQAGLLP